MKSIRHVAATLGILGLAWSAGACSSSDDAPPATDVIGSVVVVDPGDPVATSAASGAAPATGIGSIDGPATVDPDFGGANPGGSEDGG